SDVGPLAFDWMQRRGKGEPELITPARPNRAVRGPRLTARMHYHPSLLHRGPGPLPETKHVRPCRHNAAIQRLLVDHRYLAKPTMAQHCHQSSSIRAKPVRGIQRQLFARIESQRRPPFELEISGGFYDQQLLGHAGNSL